MKTKSISIDSEKLLQVYKTMDCIIIDIRSPIEYAFGHIPGSFNIPYSILISKPILYLNPFYIYYIICKNGNQSYNLVMELQKHNYPVINVSGGLCNWKGPLEKDRVFN